MKVNFVGKGVLLVAIVILSLAWLGQPALAGDDDDQGYYDHCKPLIEAVHMDFVSGVMSIWGDFCVNEYPPVLRLCGVEFDVTPHSETEVVAEVAYAWDTACMLSICQDDDDGVCDRFFLAPAPEGPDGQPPEQAWYGVVVSTAGSGLDEWAVAAVILDGVVRWSAQKRQWVPK